MINSRIVAEISRTGNVVLETLDQIEVLSFVPIFMTSFPSTTLRSDLGPIMEDIFNLEKQLRDKYIETKNTVGNLELSLRCFEEDPLFEEYKDKISVVVGYVMKHPEVAESLKSNISRDSNLPSRNFHKVMERYSKIVTNKLNTTNEEKEMYKEQKNDLRLKEKKLRTDEKNFEKRLQIERKKRRVENSTLDQDLSRLNGELNGFVREFKAGKARYDAQLQEKETAITKHYEEVRDKFLLDIDETKKKLEGLRKENLKKERVERSEVISKESMAMNSINSYDDFMISSTDEIQVLKGSFELNNIRIKELGNGIEQLKVNKKFWEKGKKEERKMFLEHLRQMQAVAVAKVAMVETWRKYRDKNFPKKKSRGGKRKKGKGKKGKGKKGKGKKGKGKGKKKK